MRVDVCVCVCMYARKDHDMREYALHPTLHCLSLSCMCVCVCICTYIPTSWLESPFIWDAEVGFVVAHTLQAEILNVVADTCECVCVKVCFCMYKPMQGGHPHTETHTSKHSLTHTFT